MESKDIVVFLDGVSRTLAGVKVSETPTTVSIENPVIVNAMPNQNGQMSLQLIPVFFREILDDKNQECIFEYQKDAIVTSNITKLDENIVAQYSNLFQPVPVEIDDNINGETVVDLFEEGSASE